MIKKIAIAVIVLIAALLVYAATRPSAFSVQRTTSIKATPEKIYPLISDFRKWGPWSPYEKKDPNMKRTYSGAASGKGSVYEWEGNREVGKGSIEITEAVPPSRVVLKLDMIKPIEGHNVVEFTLQPLGGSTNVTWAMRGSHSFVGKLLSLFISMDKMIGADFETGLASLKAVAEK
jgi:uncharacterized protein YndB with AHSA1/START domain